MPVTIRKHINNGIICNGNGSIDLYKKKTQVCIVVYMTIVLLSSDVDEMFFISSKQTKEQACEQVVVYLEIVRKNIR